MRGDVVRGLKPRLGNRALLRARALAEPALQRKRTRGFTLVEVLAALTLGALVVLFVHRLFTGVADGARRLAEAREALDREANARRWLVEAFGSLDVGNGADFAGQADQVRFAAWQPTPQGWRTRQSTVISVSRGRLVARLGTGDSLVLADSVGRLSLDYLLEPGEGTGATGEMPGERASFVREWMSPVSAPVAVRVRIKYAGRGTRDAGRVDTLLLIIGPRG